MWEAFACHIRLHPVHGYNIEHVWFGFFFFFFFFFGAEYYCSFNMSLLRFSWFFFSFKFSSFGERNHQGGRGAQRKIVCKPWSQHSCFFYFLLLNPLEYNTNANRPVGIDVRCVWSNIVLQAEALFRVYVHLSKVDTLSAIFKHSFILSNRLRLFDWTATFQSNYLRRILPHQSIISSLLFVFKFFSSNFYFWTYRLSHNSSPSKIFSHTQLHIGSKP